MQPGEKTKRKNDNEKRKGLSSSLSERQMLGLVLFAALAMGVLIIVIIEGTARF